MLLDPRNRIFVCEWCTKQFQQRIRYGRHPLYCGRSCRQRAYEERRRGAFQLGWPKPTYLRPSLPPYYESGKGAYPSTRRHALRTDGIADWRGARPTMCGARVQPSSSPFYPHAQDCCETCLRIVRRFPPARRVRPRADVGTLTAMIGTLRAAAKADDEQLRQAVLQLLGDAGAPAGSYGPHGREPKAGDWPTLSPAPFP